MRLIKSHLLSREASVDLLEVVETHFPVPDVVSLLLAREVHFEGVPGSGEAGCDRHASVHNKLQSVFASEFNSLSVHAKRDTLVVQRRCEARLGVVSLHEKADLALKVVTVLIAELGRVAVGGGSHFVFKKRGVGFLRNIATLYFGVLKGVGGEKESIFVMQSPLVYLTS